MPAPDTPQWVNKVIEVLNQDQGTRETVQWLLNDTCPDFVRGELETGKSELEKQGQYISYSCQGLQSLAQQNNQGHRRDGGGRQTHTWKNNSDTLHFLKSWFQDRFQGWDGRF